MAERLRMPGNNIVPAVDSTAARYPHWYKPFRLPDYWYYSIYDKPYFVYQNHVVESETNGVLIATGLYKNGWKIPQISAMLGNMCRESTLNPALWQGGHAPSPDPNNYKQNTEKKYGFGLVQWTGADKYIDWALEIFGTNGAYAGLDCWYNGSIQIARIMYEVEHNYQWEGGTIFPDFQDFYFSDSTDVEQLTKSFCLCYERPAITDWEQTSKYRIQWANYWYDKLQKINMNSLPIWFICKAANKWR